MSTARILIVAVGGQGNILAARILGEAAAAAGIRPRMSEFHGMAQRGGVVESMVLLGEGIGYCIADGEADILLGFEPAETIRAARKCGPHSVIITNTAPLPPFTVATGQASYPDVNAAMAELAGRVKRLIAFDAASLALQAGSPLALNMVMLGALAGSAAADIPSGTFRAAIKEKSNAAFAGANLEAFLLGARAAGEEG
ncbi:MAG TPA: indolepyruvate oxidoreductase subunit beta [Desulforhopalus sp.]|jgi:indolepyruvate ferredoxin oxidoreductase, beta subunit|nr:indolepyruvate oxidoreductase subunit beta [Desulforhopalus sp.]